MIDYQQANSLATEGLKLWGAGSLEEAADRYVKALAIVPSASIWHTAYAGVLSQLGRKSEATVEYEKALEAELAQGNSETAPSVKVARYFLADHLTQQGDPAKALDVLAPSLSALPDDWLVGTAHALALFGLGRLDEARVAAERAISNAQSESKRAELRELLGAVFAAGK